MDKRLRDKLLKRQEEGTYRSLSSFDGFVDFFSNDYLGLANAGNTHQELSTGSGGSRLLAGNHPLYEEVESEVAAYFDSPKALIFNSGYDANVGVFSSIPQRGDVVLYDEYIHASARDGIRLSLSQAFSFKHNCLDDLERQLQRYQDKCMYVVVESLYSMDGDLAPLEAIARLCKQFNAYLIVDEAHAAGVFGKGLIHQHELIEDVFLRIVTFGKAYGCHGSAVLGTSEIIAYLINFARSFIYSTALPPHAFETIRIKLKEVTPANQILLADRIRYFRKKISEINFQTDSACNSPIQLIKADSNHQAASISTWLQQHQFAVKPIFSPTVPQHKVGIRICVHAFNTTHEIDQLLDALAAFKN